MGDVVVLYHGGCSDGFCAAWVARKVLGAHGVYLPVNYGDKIPEVAFHADVCYILDFSFPLNDMVQLAIHSKGYVHLLDHHKTAIDALAPLPDLLHGKAVIGLTLDMSRSGGRLAWDHFFAGHKAPWLVDYTEDRDLGRTFDGTSKLPWSNEVNAWLRSHKHDFNLWRELERIDPIEGDIGLGNPVQEGAAILRAQAGIVSSHAIHARDVRFFDIPGRIVNATWYQSEIGAALAEAGGFGATYFRRPDGKYVLSFRSRPDGPDVSKLAKLLGGGGHVRASGATVTAEQFAELMN